MYTNIHKTSELNFEEIPLCFFETFQRIKNSVMGKFKEEDRTVFPLRSPYPLFVVRAMHEHDHLFIDRSGSVQKRLLELECYRDCMINSRTLREVGHVQARIFELRRQLDVADNLKPPDRSQLGIQQDPKTIK